MNLIKISTKLLLFVTLCIVTTGYSQSDQPIHNFPISGIFKVQKNEFNEPKRYNYIDFKNDTYALMLDNENLYIFKAVAVNNDEYILKQLTFGEHILPENTESNDNRIKIIPLEQNKYELSFIFPNRVEKIIIIKE